MQNICKILIFLISASLYAGPFGLSAGMSVEDIKAEYPDLQQIVPYTYEAKDARQSSRCEKYFFLFHPTEGLFRFIIVSSKMPATNDLGGLFHSYNYSLWEFSQIWEDPIMVDRLRPEHQWNRSSIFSIYGLFDRIAVWGAEERKIIDVERIFLIMTRDSIDSGYVITDFVFTGGFETGKSLPIRESF